MNPAKRKLHSIGPENKQLVKSQNKLQKVLGFRRVLSLQGKRQGGLGLHPK